MPSRGQGAWGNPPELTISVGAPCTMHSPVSWTHPEGLRDERKGKKKKNPIRKVELIKLLEEVAAQHFGKPLSAFVFIKIIIMLSALLRNTVNYLPRMNPFMFLLRATRINHMHMRHAFIGICKQCRGCRWKHT